MVGLHRHYRETIYSILRASLAKVVLVCGLEAHACVSGFNEIHGFSPLVSISIQRTQIPMRVQYEGKSIRRIFLYVPDFHGLTVSHNWQAQEAVSFTLILAAIITNDPQINVNWFGQYSILRQIRQDLYLEKSGIWKMTVDDINENVRRWLYCKGFLNKEDILQLQQLSGGSIPEAVHMLFSSIPKSSRKPTFKEKRSLRHSTVKTKPVYQKSCLEAIRALYL